MACSRGAFRRISVEIKDSWGNLFLRQTGRRDKGQTFVPCDGQKARELFNIFAKRFSFARGLTTRRFSARYSRFPGFRLFPLSLSLFLASPSSETLTIETAAFTGGITRPGLVTKPAQTIIPELKTPRSLRSDPFSLSSSG